MIKNILIAGAGIVAGMFAAYFLISQTNIINLGSGNTSVIDAFRPPKKEVVGFLPFWLIDKAQDDYSKYITTLSYFNVTIDSDGTIQKFTSPGESDPGWHALSTGKIDDYLLNARQKGIKLSLTVFSGNDGKINKFLEDPAGSGQNLVSELLPLINLYGFTDINMDIEKTGDAGETDRVNYINFIKSVRANLPKSITVTIDCPPIAFVKDKNLCNPNALSKTADYIVLMDYDFHNPSSFVTGPVSPQSGAGISNEFDTESAVQAALTSMPPNKLILAIPLYGYSWETINASPRSGVMPGSAFSISSKNVKQFLAECASCSAELNTSDAENHVIYLNTDTGLYHQIFYPDEKSTQIKVSYAKSENLGGIALWALGYEDQTILSPLSGYLH